MWPKDTERPHSVKPFYSFIGCDCSPCLTSIVSFTWTKGSKPQVSQFTLRFHGEQPRLKPHHPPHQESIYSLFQTIRSGYSPPVDIAKFSRHNLQMAFAIPHRCRWTLSLAAATASNRSTTQRVVVLMKSSSRCSTQLDVWFMITRNS